MQHLQRNWLLYLIVLMVSGVLIEGALRTSKMPNVSSDTVVPDSHWVAPSLYTDETPSGEALEALFYGQDLVAIQLII